MNNDTMKNQDASNYNMVNSFENNVSSVQIQQNTINSTQNQTITKEFDYDAVKSVLNEINKYKGEFINLYGDFSVQIETLLKEISSMVEKKESPSLIKKAFSTIKDLTIGISGSIIATGLVELIKPFI